MSRMYTYIGIIQCLTTGRHFATEGVALSLPARRTDEITRALTQVHVLDIQYRYIYFYVSLSLITVARVHSTLNPCSSNQCDTARLESKLTRRFKTCLSHPMRLNTRFQTRLNASYTDDHAVVRNDDSAIRGVYQILFWYTPLLSLPLLFSLLAQLSK